MLKVTIAVLTSALFFAGATAVGAGQSCTTIAAAGDGLTKDLAVIMSTHGLQNIIEGRGMTGHGPVKTTCKPGSFLTECRSAQLACK